MNDICIDQNSIVQIPQVTSTVLRPNGEFTISSIDGLIAEYQSQITQPNYINSPLNQAIETYGNDAIYRGTAELNVFFKRPDVIAILPNYPEVQDRINANVFITSLEYSEFISQFLYTPGSLSVAMELAYEPTLKQLNDFYAGSFSSSMGSFCSIAGSVFGTIGSFFSMLDSLDIENLRKSITGLLSKIQNFNAAALLTLLKEKIKDMVEKTISRVKDIIKGFNPANVIGQIETFVNKAVIGKIANLKEKAMSFFNEDNIKQLKDKIEGLIDYAVGVFEKPNMEEIMFLIQRFCSFISIVESEINKLKAPLDNFSNNYNEALRVTASRSMGNTVRAVSGGAIRFDAATRRTQINSTRQSFTDAGNPPPIDVSDIEGVTPWNEGRGDSRITFGPGLQKGAMGEEGWIRINPEVRIRLMKVQARFGRKLQVNSGYRSPAYNARIGGAKKSQHSAGNAVDIWWSGMNTQNREEFITIALEEGFRGIGRYGTRFVHIDIGPRREWTG
jgi:hypothetical protein